MNPDYVYEVELLMKNVMELFVHHNKEAQRGNEDELRFCLDVLNNCMGFIISGAIVEERQEEFINLLCTNIKKTIVNNKDIFKGK